ncbi:PREDICTED: 28S ribosomal protein S2, mitochondrial-like [Amphimedon queenslandica]|uniref:Ribosomal protein S2 n=1 Tax=Amphimedon queenslandica TaxID=400682 RepID=A0A1X7U4P1_AMPQE|nr:PREDICTED: 28S ribosomal protein S2, mitochondrial-like [Amphimedon queenslandica]|eukprot:XP_003389042.1 PREDICTED: 28S ribosomal protein S2, mitochondrial-like [Amphimedon queenslandica]
MAFLRALLKSSPALRLCRFCTNTVAKVDISFEENSNTASDIYDKFNINEIVTVRKLFEARMHLGHKHGVSNQLMKDYIWGLREKIQIFDLDITSEHLKRALLVAGLIAEKKGVILFVNSRSQFDRLIRDTATDCGEYYLSPTWRPGTFTNSQVMLKTCRLPDLVVLLNWHTNVQAIRESIMCNIPTVCLTDSDSDPRLVTYAVPGNDDTPSSVKFFCEAFRDVIRNAKSNVDSE